MSGKISQYTEALSVANDDFFDVSIDTGGGVYATRKVRKSNLGIGGNTIYTANDTISDLARVVTLAGSTTSAKLTFENLAGTDSLSIDGVGNVWNTGGGAVASNTVFGYNSLPNCTGVANTVFGFDAMKSSTSARYNVAIGHKALEDITYGDNNVAIGRLAGNSIFGGGENNVLIGASAGTSITSGDHHIGIGSSAGSTITTVSYGISIGGLSSGGGNSSIALGYQGKTTGNYSICFNSSQASRTNSTANSLEVYVDNVGTDPVFKVAQSSDSFYAGSGSFGFGTLTPDSSSVADMVSTTKGFLPPRMTTTQKNAISTPATGLVVYDSTLNKLCVYTGASWETVTSA